MRVIELSIPEALIREALPRATDEEVAALVGRFAGRSFSPDNEDLLSPFTDRDTPRDRLARIRVVIGCILTGRRNGWVLGMVSPTVERIVEAAAARA
ncbi:hypothetical protein [Methylobacterium indicum]|uniref:Uncharacterized protein n=1 Tax=Methylobacterium indicum TaxID=1775910 RepID=A0A8H8WNS7_9HYPH|nr:hypothetical protein [Methylobacterium indicum]BCM81578.1 hypothetical protein mvi_00390 [Methylobacterium indicum]